MEIAIAVTCARRQQAAASRARRGPPEGEGARHAILWTNRVQRVNEFDFEQAVKLAEGAAELCQPPKWAEIGL